MIMQLPKTTYHFNPILCPTPQKNTYNSSMFFFQPPPKKKSDASKLLISLWKMEAPGGGGQNNPSTTAITGVCWGHLAKLRLQQGLVNTLRRERRLRWLDDVGWFFSAETAKIPGILFQVFENYLGIEHRWNTSLKFLNIQLFPESSCSSGFASTSRISNSMYCISIEIYKDMSCTKDFLRGLLSYYIKRAT